MVNVVEEALDVELDNPVILPASLPHERYRIQGGAPPLDRALVLSASRLRLGLSLGIAIEGSRSSP